jgi:hypothetical protein
MIARHDYLDFYSPKADSVSSQFAAKQVEEMTKGWRATPRGYNGRSSTLRHPPGCCVMLSQATVNKKLTSVRRSG